MRQFRILVLLLLPCVLLTLCGSFFLRTVGANAAPAICETWKVVPSPNYGLNGKVLQAVSASAENNVWAVGFGNGYPGLNSSFTLTEYWDGKSWSVITSSNPPPPAGDALTGVVAISSSNVWAVGHSGSTPTIIEHWDGSSWSIVANPNPPKTTNVLNGATIIPGASKVWAVGYVQGNKAPRTLTEVNC